MDGLEGCGSLNGLPEDCIADFNTAKTIDQIRLLVVGMGGLGAVIVGKAVKLGFRTITMMDHKDWTQEDRRTQYLIPTDQENDIPINRAEASLPKAQSLNRQVQVQVETRRVVELDVTFFRNRFDVVVATCSELDDILSLNDLCRTSKIKFFVAGVFGLVGFIFSDLLDCHTFQKTVGTRYTEQTVTRWMSFVPFDIVIQYTFNPSTFRAVSPWYFVIRGFIKFGSVYGYSPSKDNPTDFSKMKAILNAELESSFKEGTAKVPDSYILMALEKEVPNICLTIGTVLIDEVIKAGTHFEEPNYNFYIFDPTTMKGEIITFFMK